MSHFEKEEYFCEDASMNLNVRGMWNTFRKFSTSPGLSDPVWYEILEKNYSELGKRPLISLYPPDHWFHQPDLYDEGLSKKFENDGYLWTASGAAVNPDIRAIQLEELSRIQGEKLALREQRRREKMKARKNRAKEREERQREAERQQQIEKQRLIDEERAKERHRLECTARLRNRGILIEHSMATTLASFLRSLKRTSGNDELSAKWLDYFNTVSEESTFHCFTPWTIGCMSRRNSMARYLLNSSMTGLDGQNPDSRPSIQIRQ